MEKLLKNKKISTAVILLCAISLLTITNYTKILQGSDKITWALKWNSENLVYNAMVLSYRNSDPLQYGLYDLYPYTGTYMGGFSDETVDFSEGYCTTEKMIAVNDNENTRKIFTTGNTITFFSGDKATVINTYTVDEYLYVEYEADEIYTYDEQGELRYMVVRMNDENRYMQMGEGEAYESQIGLQGKIFSTYPDKYTIAEMSIVYKWCLAVLFAVVLTFICYGVYKKYNFTLGAVFYIVTAISPWIIGYSTNLYWVEFTWFLPMLCGIVCANHLDNKKIRMISYIGVMLSVALKSACGYEYITTVMLSSIVFLLTDFTLVLIERKDKQKMKRLFWTIFWMGISALAGFAVALLYHAYLRGGSDIWSGLQYIYQNDVLRRTLGGDPNQFQDVYADSLNASIIRVLLRYLIFDTPLILGVPGILFVPFVILSFGALVYGVWKRNENKEMLILYIWLGIAAVSWFVLGKSHSYIHTGMNFVMWYFGFMQIVFWTLIEFAVRVIKTAISKKRMK